MRHEDVWRALGKGVLPHYARTCNLLDPVEQDFGYFQLAVHSHLVYSINKISSKFTSG